MARRPTALLLLATAAVLAAGCAAPPRGVAVALRANPMHVPATSADYVFDATVDVIDDYFTIDREQRIQVEGEIVTEGRIDTFPEVGSTLLEPWRADSANGLERLHATLQSIRRRAVARVIPTGDGFLVDVAVFKELEDLPRPERATAGAATLRHDGSLERFTDPVAGGQPFQLGWIPQGRDIALEQRILAGVEQRLAMPPRPF
jgi:hypothetical protein